MDVMTDGLRAPGKVFDSDETHSAQNNVFGIPVANIAGVVYQLVGGGYVKVVRRSKVFNDSASTFKGLGWNFVGNGEK